MTSPAGAGYLKNRLDVAIRKKQPARPVHGAISRTAKLNYQLRRSIVFCLAEPVDHSSAD